MKTFKWTALVVIVMFFIVGLVVIAWSRSGPSPQKQQTPAQPTLSDTVQIMKCPSGWHKKATDQETFRCVPNQPTMSCPDGWVYYFDGCEVGCNKTPEPPK